MGVHVVLSITRYTIVAGSENGRVDHPDISPEHSVTK
jgi:hypothetical protein